MVQDELAHGRAVGGATLGITHRVDAQLEPLGREAQTLVELHQHDDALGIGRGVGGAQPFDAHLVELAQATLLRTLAAEHRPGVPELGGSPALRDEVVLHRSAHHAGRALGAHGHALLCLEAALAA